MRSPIPDTARGVVLALDDHDRAFLLGILYVRSRMVIDAEGYPSWTVFLEGKPSQHPKSVRGIFGKPKPTPNPNMFSYTLVERPTIALLIEVLFRMLPLPMVGQASAMRDFCRTHNPDDRAEALAKFRSCGRANAA